MRPKFSEGQILGAGDLTALVVYDQHGLALHESTEHLWGLAQGLVLTTKDDQDSLGNKFVHVSVSPGRAVDRLGRAIVVTDPLPLDPGDFLAKIANVDNQKFYPVFVQAVDVDKPGDTQPGKCGVTLATRTEESLQVVFGNPGTELTVLDQQAATVDKLFDTPTSSDMVLVGWVQFDPNIQSGQFITVNMGQANGASIRYVGVVASDVVAGGGTLTLHTRPAGKRFVLSMTEDSTGHCQLAFGKQDGTNPVVPTFSVNDKGDITYAGKLSPAPPAQTLAESGLVFDGARLPLPAGVTDDDVTNGKFRIHIALTPPTRSPQLVLMPNGQTHLALPFVESCGIDAKRVLSCSIRWVDTTHLSRSVVVPAACNYLIIASGD